MTASTVSVAYTTALLRMISEIGKRMTICQLLNLLIVKEMSDTTGAPTMSDVAKKLHLTTAAATGIGDRLEILNLVKREHAAPEDRRRVSLVCEEDGLQLYSRFLEILTEELENVSKAEPELTSV